ncbi:MAG: TPM domain-containing protein [Marinobacterium sp.]|nr:TPM domain-containing protein [Marinobacterium sp.]
MNLCSKWILPCLLLLIAPLAEASIPPRVPQQLIYDYADVLSEYERQHISKLQYQLLGDASYRVFVVTINSSTSYNTPADLSLIQSWFSRWRLNAQYDTTTDNSVRDVLMLYDVRSATGTTLMSELYPYRNSHPVGDIPFWNDLPKGVENQHRFNIIYNINNLADNILNQDLRTPLEKYEQAALISIALGICLIVLSFAVKDAFWRKGLLYGGLALVALPVVLVAAFIAAAARSRANRCR